MQSRENVVFNHLVNKGLIMSKYRSPAEAEQMMIRGGLPTIIIQRILSESQKVRWTDWR